MQYTLFLNVLWEGGKQRKNSCWLMGDHQLPDWNMYSLGAASIDIGKSSLQELCNVASQVVLMCFILLYSTDQGRRLGVSYGIHI